MSCKKVTKPVKTDLKEIAKEIMMEAKNCALITVDSLGVAHARAMDPFLPQKDFTVWLGTNARSANLVNTQKEKEKFWKTEWEDFYKNKETDYLLLKFKPNKATIISEKYNILGDSISWETPTIKF